jgi:gamma-glutamyltranspeptidase / glutathione hydrolase
MAAGGNAVDACLAAVFAAFVAEGPLTGPAGGGFLLVREPRGETVVLDCFFAVPSRPLGAMEELVIDFADASTQVFHIGDESVAVPGLVAGLEAAHDRYGRLPWADLLQPAIQLARDGVPVNDAQAFLHGILVPILQRDDGGRRIYGHGERLQTEELVPALELIRDRRARAVPELLPELADDLARYEVGRRAPLTATIDGAELMTTPAPSIGGEIVRKALEGFGHGQDEHDHARALGLAYRSVGTTPRLTGTTHISVLDSDGFVAGLSSTLGSGSGVFRHGFQLNNMLGELDVIGPGPRSPGERLTSMMAPTLVLEHGRPRLVVGSAGSVRLAGAIAQVAWYVLAGASVAEAVAAPRLHVEGRTVHVEGGWDDEVSARLAARGSWDVVTWADRNLFFGGASAVEGRADGSLAAAGDPRRGGHGLVVP